VDESMLTGESIPVEKKEVDGVSDAVAREALRKAGTKLPLKTKIISSTH
jgi:ribosomal protein L16/L10AE